MKTWYLTPVFTQESQVKFYRATPQNAIPAGRGADSEAGPAAAAELPGGSVVAVRLADLVSPAAGAGRTALVVAGTPQIRTGEQLVFLKVIAAGPAVVRRDGQVQAGGHPADHARLGALEQQLDDLAGPGVIDEIAAQATLGGKVKGEVRRSMTVAAAIRATILMALMPSAGYAGVLAAVYGDLPLVPWQRPFQVPTAKVLGTWRAALGPAPLAALQARLLAAVGGEHRDHDYRAVHAGELHLGSIDGSVTRVPDTPANREAFGSTGTADDSGPYPQVRDLLAGDASTRGTLAVVSGPSGGAKAEGEQALLDTMLTRYPGVFTSDRVLGPGSQFSGRGPGGPDAGHRHPRADPGQERPGPAPDRRLLARRQLLQLPVRRRRPVVPEGPRHRIPRDRRRPGRPGDVLPDHRPA